MTVTQTVGLALAILSLGLMLGAAIGYHDALRRARREQARAWDAGYRSGAAVTEWNLNAERWGGHRITERNPHTNAPAPRMTTPPVVRIPAGPALYDQEVDS